MNFALPNRTLGTTIIAVLAIVQGAAGVMRALHWFDIGSDFLDQGLLLLPLIGVMAFSRGAFITVVALWYVAFACGALLGRSWARWLGIVVAVVSLFLVVSVVIQGEALASALLWAVVPVVMLFYLFTTAARPALSGGKS